MTKIAIKTALCLAVGGALLASPAQAQDMAPAYASDVIGGAIMISNHHDTRWKDRRYRSRYDNRYGSRNYRDERRYDDRRYRAHENDYRDQRDYRRDDKRTYCRKTDGGTGTIIGGAIGALLGREIDKHGDRTLGTVIGAAGGALIGRELEKGRCR